jgi:hypothetical protein
MIHPHGCMLWSIHTCSTGPSLLSRTCNGGSSSSTSSSFSNFLPITSFSSFFSSLCYCKKKQTHKKSVFFFFRTETKGLHEPDTWYVLCCRFCAVGVASARKRRAACSRQELRMRRLPRRIECRATVKGTNVHTRSWLLRPLLHPPPPPPLPLTRLLLCFQCTRVNQKQHHCNFPFFFAFFLLTLLQQGSPTFFFFFRAPRSFATRVLKLLSLFPSPQISNHNRTSKRRRKAQHNRKHISPCIFSFFFSIAT